MKHSIYQVHKRESLIFANCRDHFSVEENIFCLADGTTQGYNSGIWAKLLCDHFKSIKINSAEDILNKYEFLIKEFNSQEFPQSDNIGIAFIQQKSKLFGGSSTFLQVTIIENKVKVVGFGDCDFFLIKNGKATISYPFTDPIKIDNNRNFIKSNINPNEIEFRENFSQNLFIKDFELSDSDLILMASDALAKYFLNFPDDVINFLSINSFDGFMEKVNHLWDSKYLEEDDLTLIAISLIEEGQNLNFYPPDNFYFPPAETPIFIPSSNITNRNDESGHNFSKYISNLEKELNKTKQLLHKQIELNKELQTKIKTVIIGFVFVIFSLFFLYNYYFFYDGILKVTKFMKNETEQIKTDKKQKNKIKTSSDTNVFNNEKSSKHTLKKSADSMNLGNSNYKNRSNSKAKENNIILFGSQKQGSFKTEISNQNNQIGNPIMIDSLYSKR